MHKITREEYLKYFPKTYWYSVNDKDKSQKKDIGFDPDPKYLEELNKKEFAIFCSVNSFENTRQEKDVVKLNACYGDFDLAKESENLSLEELNPLRTELVVALGSLSVPPNLITSTRNGLQPLWLIDEEKVDEETIKYYKTVNEGLRDWSVEHGCKGDAVKDVARVLRVPGFYHHKQEPYMVRTAFLHDNKYSIEELLLAFPHVDEVIVRKELENVRDEINVLSGVDIHNVVIKSLTEAGHSDVYFDETGRICCDGGVSGAFVKEDHEFVGTSSSWCPDGNKVTFPAKVFGISNKEAFKWLTKNFDVPTHQQLKTKQIVSSSEWVDFPQIISNSIQELKSTDPSKIIEYGYSFLDEKLGGIFPGEMILVGGITGTGKSTFVTRIARNAASSHKVGVIALEDRLVDYGLKALYFEIGYIRKTKKLPNYPWIAFRRNEITSMSLGEEMEEAKSRLNIKNMSFMKSDSLINVDAIEEMIEEKAKDGTKLFIVDHLHMLEMDPRNNKEVLLENASKRLRVLKDRLEVTIILVAHFRKIKESDTPTMSDFKDAMAISQNANTILILWRDKSAEEAEKDYNLKTTKFYCPKTRMGLGEFTAEAKFSKETGDYIDNGSVFGVQIDSYFDL